MEAGEEDVSIPTLTFSETEGPERKTGSPVTEPCRDPHQLSSIPLPICHHHHHLAHFLSLFSYVPIPPPQLSLLLENTLLTLSKSFLQLYQTPLKADLLQEVLHVFCSCLDYSALLKEPMNSRAGFSHRLH